jgi:hypothetical protein
MLRQDGVGVLAVDGKTLRGSRSSTDGSSQNARHLLAVIDHDTATVLAQRNVDGKTSEILMLCGDVAQARVGEESPDEGWEFLQPPQRGDHGGFEVVFAGDGGFAGTVVLHVLPHPTRRG